MKSILICPALRPGVAHLAETLPLAAAPLLGKSLVEYWLEALCARGVKHVVVLASDRPHQVREIVGDGTRWGMTIDFVTQTHEATVEEARQRFRGNESAGWPASEDVVLMDYLPDQPGLPLFESYAAWYQAVQAFMPRAITPARIGVHELSPGVWVGLHAHIAPSARLQAPCWIGDYTLVGPHAQVGPDAILDDRVVVEEGARITRSVVAPETFVGEHISLEHSLAQGATVVNWTNGSCLRVPDEFFLCSLDDRRFAPARSSLLGRVLAAAAMAVTAPVALLTMALSSVRGDSPLVLRLGVRPQRGVRTNALQTFAYYELANGNNWLRRWPQFWSIVRGDFAWVGNRPLRPTQALALTNDFERLWLTAPVGLVSLADANGCTDGELSDEICAHASYYAVNASRRLDASILRRGLYRAAFAWPVRWTRRKDRAMALQQLVGKQEA